MAITPIDLLRPLCSLYGIDANNVNALALDSEKITFTEYLEPHAILREITVRDWTKIEIPDFPTSQAEANATPDEAPTPAPAESEKPDVAFRTTNLRNDLDAALVEAFGSSDPIEPAELTPCIHGVPSGFSCTDCAERIKRELGVEPEVATTTKPKPTTSPLIEYGKYDKLKRSELNAMCRERGLEFDGTKGEVITRLMANAHPVAI